MTDCQNPSEFDRELYGVLGVLIDAIDMKTALRKVEAAASLAKPFLVSTVNLNFLVMSQTDAEFRESLIQSDLCTADGMPIVWIARLLGIPLAGRIAGSDLFDALRHARSGNNPLKAFLFGGSEGAAESACRNINAQTGGIKCVGSYYPGYSDVETMSTEAILDAINSSGAHFFAAALGAKKGQIWLLRNHERLRVPVRVHLGATINFQAGTVGRAPKVLRAWGLEWLWRIKEEPQLWRRYFGDGLVFLRLLATRVFPLLIANLWGRAGSQRKTPGLSIVTTKDHKSVTLSINGEATGRNIGVAVSGFQEAVATAKPVVINFADTRSIDARFFGLLLVLYKRLKEQRLGLEFIGVSPQIARLFRLNGFEFLLRG